MMIPTLKVGNVNILGLRDQDRISTEPIVRIPVILALFLSLTLQQIFCVILIMYKTTWSNGLRALCNALVSI